MTRPTDVTPVKLVPPALVGRLAPLLEDVVSGSVIIIRMTLDGIVVTRHGWARQIEYKAPDLGEYVSHLGNEGAQMVISLRLVTNIITTVLMRDDALLGIDERGIHVVDEDGKVLQDATVYVVNNLYGTTGTSFELVEMDEFGHAHEIHIPLAGF